MPFLTKPLSRKDVTEEVPPSFRFDFSDKEHRFIVIEDPPKKFRVSTVTGPLGSRRSFVIAKPWSYMIFSTISYYRSEVSIRRAIVFFSHKRVQKVDSGTLCYAPLPNMRYSRIWMMSPGICMGDARHQSYGSFELRLKSFHDTFWSSPFTDEVPMSAGVAPRWMKSKDLVSKMVAWERRSKRSGRIRWNNAPAVMRSVKKAAVWLSASE